MALQASPQVSVCPYCRVIEVQCSSCGHVMVVGSVFDGYEFVARGEFAIRCEVCGR